MRTGTSTTGYSSELVIAPRPAAMLLTELQPELVASLDIVQVGGDEIVQPTQELAILVRRFSPFL